MIHLVRFIVFTAVFFIGYKIYPIILEDELLREVTGAGLIALLVVGIYAFIENREKNDYDDKKTNIRDRST
jgi:hypothetical protein